MFEYFRKLLLNCYYLSPFLCEIQVSGYANF